MNWRRWLVRQASNLNLLLEREFSGDSSTDRESGMSGQWRAAYRIDDLRIGSEVIGEFGDWND